MSMKLLTSYYVAGLFLLTGLLSGCDQKDDIDEIFCSGTWYVVDYYTNFNWSNLSKDAGVPVNGGKTDVLSVIQQFSLQFKDDGTFEGKIQNGTYTGQWQAHPDDRSVSFRNVQASPLTGHNKEFIQFLQKSTLYQGNSKLLHLTNSEKAKYLQLNHGQK